MSARRTALALALAAGAALLAGCGQGGSSNRASETTTTTRATSSPATVVASTTATTTPASHRAVRPRPRRPAPDPGALPQTDALPSAQTRAFHAEMAALWRGVQTGRTAPALSAFFPKAAYVQIKAEGDPAGDWLYRLVAGYALDLRAAHALLGVNPARARLIGVTVARADVHWVPPGVCYNRVGYYEVPNSRMVYRLGGAVRSFGVASMISWRGVWYVIHLGAVDRHAVVGIVDDPESGPGAPLASSTC